MTHSAGQCAFLDLWFDTGSDTEFIAEIKERAQSDTFSFVATPNVDHMVRLHQDDRTSPLWAAYEMADLTICDSRILSRLAALSGLDLPAVPGSDITAQIVGNPEFHGMHFHVVGGSAAMMRALERMFPNVRWTQLEPPQNVLRDKAAQEAIVASAVASRADILFMAIGSPQSELVCRQIALTKAARGVALCIGASLEFVTGEKARAPVLFQQLGLEWLFRLLSEPKRLWRRYLFVGPRIFLIWLAWRRRRTAASATR